MITGERTDDGESLRKSAHRFAAGRRCSAACHPWSLFRYPKTGKMRASILDSPSGAGSLSFRISTVISLCERDREGADDVKIGRQDQRGSAISSSNAETILV